MVASLFPRWKWWMPYVFTMLHLVKCNFFNMVKFLKHARIAVTRKGAPMKLQFETTSNQWMGDNLVKSPEVEVMLSNVLAVAWNNSSSRLNPASDIVFYLSKNFPESQSSGNLDSASRFNFVASTNQASFTMAGPRVPRNRDKIHKFSESKFLQKPYPSYGKLF